VEDAKVLFVCLLLTPLGLSSKIATIACSYCSAFSCVERALSRIEDDIAQQNHRQRGKVESDEDDCDKLNE
jgi:hypothetical protein